MNVLMVVEKAAKILDEMGRIPFSESDLYDFIKEHFKENVTIEQVREALETLSISSGKPAPMRKCIYKEKNGYSYLYACSFGIK